MPIEHRAFKNTAVGALSFLITLCQTIVLVPVLLKYWGNVSYGLWLTLMAGFSLLQTLDLGHQNYVGNQLNMQYHTDLNQFRRTLGSSLLIAYFLGLVEIGICLLLISSGTMNLFLSVPSQVIAQHQLALGLLLLMTMWLVFGSVGGIIVRIMIPAGMLYESQWVGIAMRLTQFFSIVIIAVGGGGILAACLWYAVIQSVMSLVVLRYVKLKLPQFYPWWHAAQWREGLRGLKKSLLLTFNSIGNQLSNNGLVILVSTLSGPVAVPVFTTVRTLANLWTNVTNVLSTPLLPDIVRYHATGEGQKIVTISEAYWVLVGTTVNLGVLITYPLIKPLYGYWTTHAVVLDKSLLCLLLASVVLSNVGGLITLYLNGINSLGIVLTVSVLRGICSLGIGGFLFFHLGLAGLGIGILSGELLALLVMGRYFVKHELSRQGVSLPIRSLVQITVSTASVLLFLMSEGFGFSLARYLYPVALLGVAVAALWGWRGLEPGVRDRLLRMIGDRFIRKDFA